MLSMPSWVPIPVPDALYIVQPLALNMALLLTREYTATYWALLGRHRASRAGLGACDRVLDGALFILVLKPDVCFNRIQLPSTCVHRTSDLNATAAILRGYLNMRGLPLEDIEVGGFLIEHWVLVCSAWTNWRRTMDSSYILVLWEYIIGHYILIIVLTLCKVSRVTVCERELSADMSLIYSSTSFCCSCNQYDCFLGGM